MIISDIGWLKYYKYQIYIEDFLKFIQNIYDPENHSIHNTEYINNCKHIWEKGILKYGQFMFIWTEYLNWLNNQNNLTVDLYLKLYKRIIASSNTIIDIQLIDIAKEW